MPMTENLGPVHFIGIGGIGMSAIAEVLHNMGTRVQGSDGKDGANVERLRAKGITVHVGHDAGNLGDARVVVTSTAIQESNPERMAAIENHIPVVPRAEMLAELMRFKSGIAVGGTHGKTTTTSLVGRLLIAGGLDPTIINGGILMDIGTNARMGDGEWLVAEADESDGSFLKLPAEIAIITNMDPEHLDHYGTFENAKEAFKAFVEAVPFYGAGVLCIDHPEVHKLMQKMSNKPIVTYGTNVQADVRFTDVRPDGGRTFFDVHIRNRRDGTKETWRELMLPMPGQHNVSNATAAIAVAHRLGVGEDAVREGLADFKGVGRRFTHTGSWNGVEVYDDYAHHPVEITAVLSAARQALRAERSGRVIAIKQPHRYTRLKDLFDEFCGCFDDADIVLVAPVYTAGEAPLGDYDSDKLVRGLRAAGHRNVRAVADRESVADIVAAEAEEGDIVIYLGAGDITAWAHSLPGALAKLPAQ
ncbi:UDP-N-acetylmuramate--L-alanine ligase [Rhizobiaceae bacterium]|nr:UDP-N-acetylmuramate--L-alanine ligase [Rhizobiaceae bacterium]